MLRKPNVFAVLVIVTSFLFCGAASSSAISEASSSAVSLEPALEANPLDKLPPGQWYEVPGSRLDSVDPCPSRACPYSGVVGLSGIVTAWSGGAYDTSRDRLLVWGGGHADYAGNEIYAFDVNALKWSRLWGPTADVPAKLLPGTETYTDGNPVSRHTYGGLAYVESTDQLFSQGGSLYNSGNGTRATWVFDFKTSAWQRKHDNESGAVGIWAQSAYDPVTKHVFHQDNNGLMEYDPVANTWTARGRIEGGVWSGKLTAAIDPVRRLFVAVGGGTTYVWNLNTFQLTKPATKNGNAIVSANAPGFVYNASNGKFLAWNGGAKLHQLDPVTWAWTVIDTVEKSDEAPSAPVQQGTYGRFQYIPSKNAVIVVNGVADNVYIYKLPGTPVASRSYPKRVGIDDDATLNMFAQADTLIAALRKPTSGLPVNKPVITSFKLVSPVSQSAAPFSFGHGFRRGDIPQGQSIVANIRDFQADIKNRWPDGSAKFAVLSGRAKLTGGMAQAIKLYAAPPLFGKNLTEQDLLGTGITAAIKFSPYGAVALNSLIGHRSTYNAAAHRWTPGLVRQWINGPEVASWIYYSPIGSDPHLAAWFEVKLWRDGAVEVLPWIENGYLNINAPGEKIGEGSFSLGNETRYSGTLNLPHHTRAVLASGTTFSYWFHANPQITVKPDIAYLTATKLVPAYYSSTPSSSLLFTRIVQSYTPTEVANVPAKGMGSAGYSPWIGLIPEHDVAYLTSGADPRAMASVIVNGYAAGSFGTHYRDELTNQPLRFSNYPNLVVNDHNSGIIGAGASTKNTFTPQPSGKAPGEWDVPHHPSMGYMAYLLTGRFYFMEESQFVATVNFLQRTDSSRQLTKNLILSNHYTTRGAAWALRSLAQAAAVTPDNDALQAEFSAAIENNVNYYHAKYIAKPNNPQGLCEPYSNYVDNSLSGAQSNAKPWTSAIWMEDFLTASWGYLKDISGGDLSLAAQEKLNTFLAWKYKSIIGRLGSTGPSEFFFLDAAQYTLPYAPRTTSSTDWENGNGPWYSDWGQIYQAALGKDNPGLPLDNRLRDGHFPEATSYWGNLQPAIAYAVDAGAIGALDAYKRMIGAANWKEMLTGVTGFSDNPVWGVKPRRSMASPAASDVQSRMLVQSVDRPADY
ncbi:MAG: hypothetical protein V4568_17245 [Pseudomonadota bacterium]